MNFNELTCPKCGGEIIETESGCRCKFCRTQFKEDTLVKQAEALSGLLDKEKQEKVANLRTQLWKRISDEYTDSEQILRLCREIKSYLPQDFFASFFEAANEENDSALISFLDSIDVESNLDDVSTVLDFSLKSLNGRNMMSVCNLIERAYKNTDLERYSAYRTKYDEESQKVNDCVYDPELPRDAFICYSSKDMETVQKLVDYLEENGLTCFVAIRNLQHGRNAAQNYWISIKKAIDNCKAFVFISSTNSRSVACDTKEEVRYVLDMERKTGEKKQKVEYLIENYTGKAAIERTFKKFFEGLEYCYDPETVFDRLMAADEEPAPAEPEEKEEPDIPAQVEEEEEYNEYEPEPEPDYIPEPAPSYEHRRAPAPANRRSVEPDSSYTPAPAPKRSAKRKKATQEVMVARGQRVLVEDENEKIYIHIEYGANIADALTGLYIFPVTAKGKVLSEKDLVFSGNLVSFDKSIELRQFENYSDVTVNLSKTDFETEKIKFIVAAMGIGNTRKRAVPKIDNARFTIQVGEVLYVFDPTSCDVSASHLLFEFYRYKGSWKINFTVLGLDDGIEKISNGFGIEVED